MTRRVVFAARAERQLEALYRFIAAEAGGVRAESYVGRIVEFCERLRQFPERGNRRDDIRPGLRTIGFRRRVTIAFTVSPEEVAIVGIFYGGQDYGASTHEEVD